MEDQLYNLSDELERKTLEALSSLLEDFEQGIVSPSQAACGLRALFTATSGLVSKDIFEMMSTASAQINARTHEDVRRRVFANAKQRTLVVIEYCYGNKGVTFKRCVYPTSANDVGRWEKNETASFADQTNPYEAAHERFEGYARVLQRHGFQELV